MSNALAMLVGLPGRDKQARGIIHTPQEILQQPETWRSTFNMLAGRQAEIAGFLRQSGVGAGGARPTVFLIGAGTSDYIGRSLTNVLRQHWQCDVRAVPSTDLLTNFDDLVFPDAPYLWISFSRSGDSSEGVAVLEQALHRRPGIRHLIITCNRQGQMVKFSSHPGVMALVLEDRVNDRGLAMTSSFSNLVVAGQYLAHCGSQNGYQAILETLSQTGSKLLPRAADAASELAATNFSRVCFVGSGALAAVAHECALKVLELTSGKICTLAESTLGLRHGPLSAVNRETLIVCHVSGAGHRRQYDTDLLREIREKKLGRKTLVVTPHDGRAMEGLADTVLALEPPSAIPDSYRPPVDVMVGQLLGLFSSLQMGLQPDSPSPSNAISRVVSHVRIHAAASSDGHGPG